MTGRRKRAREELAPLPEARLSLAEAVRAGARLEPGLVYRALPFAIEPEWTQAATASRSRSRSSSSRRSRGTSPSRDGLPLRVVEHATDAPADATVTMSRAAFERLLKDEPQPLGDRPQVKGDRDGRGRAQALDGPRPRRVTRFAAAGGDRARVLGVSEG